MICFPGGCGPLQPIRLALATLVFLAACTSAGPPVPPRIDRLSVSAEPARTPSPALTTEALVVMARSGASPEAVVDSWRRDGARLKIGATEVIELRAHGVSLPVLDALLDARDQALRTDLETRLATQQAAYSKQLAIERARPNLCPAPYYGGFAPYGGWGSNGGWWGGAYRGW